VLLTPALGVNSLYRASTAASPETTLTSVGQSRVDVALA
jgi:hypothetical protein